MAIAAAENETQADQDAPPEQIYWRIKAEGLIRKGIPIDDIPRGYRAAGHTVIEDKRGGWESNTGRPAFNVPDRSVERFHPPTEWGDDMFAFRMAQVQWTGNWSDERLRRVTHALRPFLRRVTAGEFGNAGQAGDGAVDAVRASWPTWTGERTRAAITQLGMDIYEAGWRPEFPDTAQEDMITDAVMGFQAQRGGTNLEPTDRRHLIAVLVEMTQENLTFASDGDRWKAVHDRCKKGGRQWHMGYSDVAGSIALRDLLRKLWPDTIVIPDHIAAMDEQELRSTLTQHEAREKAAHAELWRKAEERGWCPEFDAILVRAGYPPRPKKYTINYTVKFTAKPTPREVQDWTGHKVTFEPGALTMENSVNLTFTHEAAEPPTKEQAREWLTDEMIREGIDGYFGRAAGNATDREIGAVTIGTITAR